MNLTEGQLFTIEALNRFEGFVWPDKANFADFDSGSSFVFFRLHEPKALLGSFYGGYIDGSIVDTGVVHPDWRNSLITREQFDSVDGWVRNDGSKPVISGDFDLLLADGEAIYFCDIRVDRWDWSVPCKGGVEITHWRHNKPNKEAEMQPEAPKQPSIDELYSQYKAQRGIVEIAKKTLADEMEAEDKLLEQIKAWNLDHGFDIRALDESDEVPDVEPELVITDWRDLLVGDVIFVSASNSDLVVKEIRSGGVMLIRNDGDYWLPAGWPFKFISRPSNK